MSDLIHAYGDLLAILVRSPFFWLLVVLAIGLSVVADR